MSAAPLPQTPVARLSYRPPMESHLDNVFWKALSGPQLRFSTGSARARRYAPGLSPIFAFADLEHPDFDGLAPHCPIGEHFYTADWRGPVPRDWQLVAEATMHRMVWRGDAMPDDLLPEATRLGPEHAQQAVELAALTRPGPFGPRTLELGDYFGVVDDGRLVAMAGERSTAGTFREVSGVCTHPEFQGRGLARKLMDKLARRQLMRRETPFLHVMCSNEAAHALYLRMGFRDHLDPVVVRVLSRS